MISIISNRKKKKRLPLKVIILLWYFLVLRYFFWNVMYLTLKNCINTRTVVKIFNVNPNIIVVGLITINSFKLFTLKWSSFMCLTKKVVKVQAVPKETHVAYSHEKSLLTLPSAPIRPLVEYFTNTNLLMNLLISNHINI